MMIAALAVVVGFVLGWAARACVFYAARRNPEITAERTELKRQMAEQLMRAAVERAQRPRADGRRWLGHGVPLRSVPPRGDA